MGNDRAMTKKGFKSVYGTITKDQKADNERERHADLDMTAKFNKGIAHATAVESKDFEMLK